MTGPRRFEFVEGRSSKFWEIGREGACLTVRYGRLGTDGRTLTRTFPTEDAARAEHDKLVREKLRKGYVEADAAAGAEPEPASDPADAAPSSPPAPAPERPAAAASADAPPEDADRIVWNDECVRMVAPRPDGGVGEGAPCRLKRKTAFEKLAEVFRDSREAWLRGAEHTTPECARLVRAVVERLGGGAKGAARPMDPDEAGLLIRVLWMERGLVFVGHDVIFDYVIGVGGLGLAVAAMARCFDFHLTAGGDAAPGARLVLPSQGAPRGVDRGVPVAWNILRRRLAAAPPADLAAARLVAERCRREADPGIRCALAYLFPDEPAWSAEDARGLLAKPAFEARDVGHALILLSAVRAPALAEALAERVADGIVRDMVDDADHAVTQHACTIVDLLGARAVPVLARLLDAFARRAERAGEWGRGGVWCARALALVQSEAVARHLVRHVRAPKIREIAAAFFDRAPGLAFGPLAEAVNAGGPGAAEAEALLKQLLTVRHAEFVAVRPRLAPETVAAVEGVLGGLVVEASPEELPAVLVQPPWLDSASRPEPRVIPDLEPLPLPEAVLWEPGEQQAARAAFDWPSVGEPSAETDRRLLARAKKAAGDGAFYNCDEFFETASPPVRLRIFNEGNGSIWWNADAHVLEWMLATHGLDALPGIRNHGNRVVAADVLGRARTPRVAPFMAEVMVRSARARPTARAWLERFPEEAAAGLIPDALGEPGWPRTAAERALRHLAERGHAGAVRAVAARFGAEVAAAVDELLYRDPAQEVPSRIPSLPYFLQMQIERGRLPRVYLVGRRRVLPPGAIPHLLTMLAFSPLDPPYVGIEQVKAACDPASLAEFAWALFEVWLDTPPRTDAGWLLKAVGHFGDDDAVRRLAPRLRDWPSKGKFSSAVVGLDVLVRIGTDVALTHLHGVATRTRSKGLQERARAKIAELAEARGLSPEELEDRLVPDLDLDPDGACTLDFGARVFRVGFDELLRPFVVDATGKRLRSLPKPGRSDDAAKAKAAATRWKALKKDVADVAKIQVARLEQAMCARRRWDVPTFRRYLVEHPLMFHLTRRLVWATADDEGRPATTFRVAEDRTLADVDDALFDLPEDATVMLPHPVELPAEALAIWGQVLADYELLQPFPQIGREVHRPAVGEHSVTRVDRLDGRVVPTGQVLGLERRGWRLGDPQEAGVIYELRRDFPGGLRACLELSGVSPGAVDIFPEQTLGEVTVSRVGRRRDGEPLPLGDLDPIVFSELMADLATLDAS